MNVLTVSAKSLFVSTIPRSCLAQKILYLGIHILAYRSGMLLITKWEGGKADVKYFGQLMIERLEQVT